jgi:hypothetical protein
VVGVTEFNPLQRCVECRTNMPAYNNYPLCKECEERIMHDAREFLYENRDDDVSIKELAVGVNARQATIEFLIKMQRIEMLDVEEEKRKQKLMALKGIQAELDAARKMREDRIAQERANTKWHTQPNSDGSDYRNPFRPKK